jgi:hypothetical protein
LSSYGAVSEQRQFEIIKEIADKEIADRADDGAQTDVLARKVSELLRREMRNVIPTPIRVTA